MTQERNHQMHRKSIPRDMWWGLRGGSPAPLNAPRFLFASHLYDEKNRKEKKRKEKKRKRRGKHTHRQTRHTTVIPQRPHHKDTEVVIQITIQIIIIIIIRILILILILILI